MNGQSELAIFEAGISEPGGMRTLRNIIRPTIGILTNIGGRTKKISLLFAGKVHGETPALQKLRCGDLQWR